VVKVTLRRATISKAITLRLAPKVTSMATADDTPAVSLAVITTVTISIQIGMDVMRDATTSSASDARCITEAVGASGMAASGSVTTLGLTDGATTTMSTLTTTAMSTTSAIRTIPAFESLSAYFNPPGSRKAPLSFSSHPWYYSSMSKKFVSADHHWFHEAMIRMLRRPFANVTEMNEVMVERWNSVVKPNDLVYYAGDMFYKGRPKECEELFLRLNGKIHMAAEGNHDGVTKKFKHRFQSWEKRTEIVHDGHTLVIDHYSMRVWNKSYHGSYHVYGHSHGQLPEDPASLSFDVGVDCWNFYPLMLDEIFEKMRTKEVARGNQRVEPNRPEKE